jgi:cytochrome c peroxidase
MTSLSVRDTPVVADRVSIVAPTILNALYNKTEFWDGARGAGGAPIVNPLEMGHPSMDAAVARITAIEEYQQTFREVFGQPPNGGANARGFSLAFECQSIP